MTSKFGKFSAEEMDDALNRIDELFHAINDRLVFVDAYVKAEIGFGLKVRFEECGSQDFVAFFQVMGKLGRGRRFAEGHHSAKHNLPDGRDDRNDCAVFVTVVELSQGKKSVSLPSLVRLYSADKFFGIGARVLEEFPYSGVVRELIFPPVYREVCMSQMFLGSDAIGDDQACRERVERAHQIVKQVTCDGAKGFGDRFTNTNPVDLNGWFRVRIDNHLIRIATRKGFDLGMKVSKVFFGPVDLYSRTEKRVLHGKAA